jgi:hypothetical protein
VAIREIEGEKRSGRERSIYWNGRCTFRTGGTDRKDSYFLARPRSNRRLKDILKFVSLDLT